MSDSLWPHGLSSPWNSPSQNTGVGSLCLPQGIFPTQGLNPGLPHCGQILYQLRHQGSPGILEWEAYPFFSRSSWPRNRTGISCIAGRFFINWAMRKVQERRVSSFYSHIPIWWKDLKPNFYQVIWGEGRTQEDMKIKRKTELDVSPESQAVPKIWTIGVYWFWVKGSIVNVIQLLF